MTCNTDFAVPDLVSEVAYSEGLWTLGMYFGYSKCVQAGIAHILKPDGCLPPSIVQHERLCPIHCQHKHSFISQHSIWLEQAKLLFTSLGFNTLLRAHIKSEMTVYTLFTVNTTVSMSTLT